MFQNKSLHLIIVILALSTLSLGCAKYDFMSSLLGKSTSGSSSNDDGSNSSSSVESGSGSDSNSNSDSNSDSDSTGSNPATPVTPISPTLPYTKAICNLLIDQTGVYFTPTGNSNYVALTGVTECLYNSINNISGPCNENVQLTIIKPEDVSGSSTADLIVDQTDLVTIEPGTATFLFCVSFTNGVFMQTPISTTNGVKIIISNPPLHNSDSSDDN